MVFIEFRESTLFSYFEIHKHILSVCFPLSLSASFQCVRIFTNAKIAPDFHLCSFLLQICTYKNSIRPISVLSGA